MLRAVPLALILLVALPLGVLAHAPTSVEPVAMSTRVVSGGSGNQTDPHVSGTLAAFTSLDSASSEIRYKDLATGVAGVIANGGNRDSLPDVSGSTIVFRRVYVDSSRRIILAFDTASPELGVREVAPLPGARRAFASVGADTVAFMQFREASSTESDVCVASLANISAPAHCVGTSTEPMSHRDPDVSEDGGTVAWSKCLPDGTGCDVYVARRGTDGTWGAPRQLTDSTGEDILPDTNGEIVTYASNAGGDYDIWWESTDGTDEHQLVLDDAPGSIETNPNVSGGLITFERELPGSTNADLYGIRPATNELYRLTTTESDETLNDVSVSAAGVVQVVWAQPDGLFPGHNDIHAGTFSIAQGPDYVVCPLFDQSRSFRLGATAPIRLQLCDENGANGSDEDTRLVVTGLVKRDASAAAALVEDAGNANPDSTFRYDAELGGYVYNLATRGLSRGTWELQFSASTDPGSVYRVTFDLR